MNAKAVVTEQLMTAGSSVKGMLSFSDELLLDGTVAGDILSEGGSLTLNKTGTVTGHISVRYALVFGRIDGGLQAERCVLKASAVVLGDIQSESLVIEEGASFAGRSSRPAIYP